MLLILIKTILSGIASPIRVKSLGIGKKYNISKFFFARIGYSGGAIVGTILFFLGKVYLSELMNIKLVFLTLSAIIIEISADFLDQKICKEEKLSALLPFSNLKTIFVMIIGFLFLGYFDPKNKISIISFCLGMLAIAVMVAFSIDYKNFKLPKVLPQLIFLHLMKAIKTIIAGYVLINMSSGTYLLFTESTMFIIITICVLFKGDLKNIKNVKKDFYKNRYTSCLIFGFTTLMGFMMMKGYGVVVSSLFGMLGLIIKLIVGYFVLGDKPSNKNITLAIIVSIIVGFALYFK